MLCKGVNSIEGSGSRANPLAIGVRHGEGDCRVSNPANTLRAIELPLVKLSLLGASGGENNCIPSGDPRRVPH